MSRKSFSPSIGRALVLLGTGVWAACGGNGVPNTVNNRSESKPAGGQVAEDEVDLTLTSAQLNDVKEFSRILGRQIDSANVQLKEAYDVCTKAFATRAKILELMGPVAPELVKLKEKEDALAELVRSKIAMKNAKARELVALEGEIQSLTQNIAFFGRDVEAKVAAEKLAVSRQILRKKVELKAAEDLIAKLLGQPTFDQDKYKELDDARDKIQGDLDLLSFKLANLATAVTTAATADLAKMKARLAELQAKYLEVGPKLKAEIAGLATEVAELQKALKSAQEESARDKEASGIVLGTIPAGCTKLGIK